MWSHTGAGDVERLVQPKGVRITKAEPVEAFGNDDRVETVGREIHVVGIVNRNRASGLARQGIDRCEAVPDVVRDVKSLQVVGGRDVLREPADREMLDDLE